jgi:hypothetical protein
MTMERDHVRVLSDLVNLKLYLLAQCQTFSSRPEWLLARLPATETADSVARRIDLLLRSGLWVCQDRSIRTVAPTIDTGDGLAEEHLHQTHENLLTAAREALDAPAERRVFGGQTFLFDRRRLAAIADRVASFKQELEAEFEDLTSDHAYQVHIAFFELEPGK